MRSFVQTCYWRFIYIFTEHFMVILNSDTINIYYFPGVGMYKKFIEELMYQVDAS